MFKKFSKRQKLLLKTFLGFVAKTTIVGLLFVFLISFSILYYNWLSGLKPDTKNELEEINANTIHSPVGTKVLEPTQVDMSGEWTRISNEIPNMGTHYINVFRLFASFDPHKPTGYITWKGKMVGYVYTSTQPVEGYHWHFHKNMCLKPGLVPTTTLSPLECLLHGYYWWPFNRWMLHVWLNKPEDVNGLWNEKLQ